MMASFTQHIASPASVFASLRASTEKPSQSLSKHHKSPAEGTQPIEILGSNADLAGATATNAQTVTTGANNMSHIVRRQSPQVPAGKDISHPEETVSRNPGSRGHQVIKIPYQPTASVPERKSSYGMKTGKKTFALGNAVTTDTGHLNVPTKTSQSIAPSKHVDQTRPAIPVFPALSCNLLDKLKEQVHQRREHPSVDFKFAVQYNSSRQYISTSSIINRSLFYTLSDPEALLKSFRDANREFADSPLPHLDSARLAHTFRDWEKHNGALVFDSLWIALGALFTPPPDINNHECSRGSTSAESQSKPSSADKSRATEVPRYLTTHEAAHIVVVCVHALTSLIPIGWPHVWLQIRHLRSWGVIVPNAPPNTDTFFHPFMDIIDQLEHEPALRLMDRLLRAIGARICFERISKDVHQKDEASAQGITVPLGDGLVETVVQHMVVTERVALSSKHKLGASQASSADPGWTVTATFLEWLRTIMIKKWDCKPQICKWSSVGVAVQIHDILHANCDALNLRLSMFEMPLFNEKLDQINEPSRFINWVPTLNELHIFQYPSLFSTHQLVTYFRTINFTTMFAQYDHTIRTQSLQNSLDIFLKGPVERLLSSQMKTTLSDRLFLAISRENALEDTLDLLWGQERRMLLKPLKVKIGTESAGDYGTDMGGVTNEYFSLVLQEAFKPDNGMFTIDSQTRMTWFQPGTLEAPWKFEMIGLLFSLAVYNGVTLPVTFPLAFYHTMLRPTAWESEFDCNVTTEYIKDGWPNLAKSFDELLSWSDGDVGDVIMRDYVFSYEVFGQKMDHDMSRPFNCDPSVIDTEPQLVTNANRERFVRDYIRFLTYESIQPQLMAFREGFLTCLQSKSLSFFTPTLLRDLVEGSHHISIPSLRKVAIYDEGYTANSTTIRAFWTVVESYNQEDAHHLLEFVTASDRIPITGYDNVVFKIHKIAGQPDSLPSASTCFATLYLPDYGDAEVLRTKLGTAIQNCKGFGIA
ncbi:hypothetical protein NX059_008020 [Plenodomus lindquistii]|nr:hypothetical protein NX059_008020 [Plenodomus lindquistii]